MPGTPRSGRNVCWTLSWWFQQQHNPLGRLFFPSSSSFQQEKEEEEGKFGPLLLRFYHLLLWPLRLLCSRGRRTRGCTLLSLSLSASFSRAGWARSATQHAPHVAVALGLWSLGKKKKKKKKKKEVWWGNVGCIHHVTQSVGSDFLPVGSFFFPLVVVSVVWLFWMEPIREWNLHPRSLK